MDSEKNTLHLPLIPIHNPFNAPVFYEDTVSSTMDISRILARQGEPHGTVITADFQEEGRGRIRGRSWDTEKGTNLLLTILLRYPRIEDIPPALTLRTGLAASHAIEDFAPTLAGKTAIKWPNDILISGKKIAGILTEAEGGLVPHVHIGIGVNVAQRQFPDFLIEKAASISLAADREIANEERYALLEKILTHLHAEIEVTGGDTGWRSGIEARLYKKGEQVSFIEGPANSGKKVNGILTGIGPNGELIISPAGSFLTGELVF